MTCTKDTKSELRALLIAIKSGIAPLSEPDAYTERRVEDMHAKVSAALDLTERLPGPFNIEAWDYTDLRGPTCEASHDAP